MKARLRAALGAALALCLFSTTFAARQVPRRPDYDALGLGRRPESKPVVVEPSRGEIRAGTTVHVEERLGVPTFLWAGERGRLATSAKQASVSAPEAARQHLREYAHLYKLDSADVEAARASKVHDTGRGGRIVSFTQEVDGVVVFRDEMKMILDRSDNLVAISGYLTRPEPRSRVFRLAAQDVLASALEDLTEFPFAPHDLQPIRGRRGDLSEEQRFLLAPRAEADSGLAAPEPLRARKVWFRLSDGLEPAWLMDINIGPDSDVDAAYYGYVVSAVDGAVLLRKNFTVSESFSYRVWADPVSKVPDDGPQGTDASPHPTGTPNGFTPTFVAQRLVSLQNGPISTNDPWLDANNNLTNGNNVDAYADLNAPDGAGSPGDTRANTTSLRTFDRIYNTALDPGVSVEQRRASITQLFYTTNWLHDDYYDHGFNEASGNAQKNNYGRGGAQNDDMRAEAQDYSGRNNANMSTPPDGSRPRMQMFIFDGPGVSSLTVHAPAPAAGGYAVGNADFGPQSFTIATTDVVLVNDGVVDPNAGASVTDGCNAPFVNAADVSGKIALVDRGVCTFLLKVQNAEDAGAVGVIIANNTTGGFNMTSSGGSVSIPSLSITQADGGTLKANLTGLNATMSRTSSADNDGTIDNQIVAHEWGHYISNRLIGNAFGLNTNMSGGLGEGWGDFHALMLTVRDGDANRPANAMYSGAYAIVSYSIGGPGSQSYYYGIRRAPLSTDPNINPLTYKHIQNGVALPAGPPLAFGHSGASNAEVHNSGEIWSLMLWECYAGLLRDTLGGSPRLTFAQAQSRMKDYLVGGYKMTPNSPTFLEARDAVLAAAFANDVEDYEVCWEAFAKRGAGVGAVSPDRFSSSNIGVVESFVTGGALDPISVTLTDDVATDCLPDGILDNGETGTLALSLKNTGSSSLSATTGTVSSTNPNISFPAGNVINFAPSGPFGTTGGSVEVALAGEVGADLASLQINVDDPGLAVAGPIVIPESYRVNADEVPNAAATETAESSLSVMSTSAGAGLAPWSRKKITGVDHRWHGPDNGSAGSIELTTPSLNVGGGTFSFTFQHRHLFEASGGFFYDGGVIELSNNGGATWTDIGASITTPGGGYNGTLEVGGSNPLEARQAFSAVSAGYPALNTVTVNLGTTYQGQTVRIRFRIGTDVFVSDDGWEIDNIAFTGITNLPFPTIVPHDPVCDDDGDSIVDTSDCAPSNPSLWSAPSAVLTLAAQAPVAGNVQFNWTAPGDFGGVAAPTYDLVRSSLKTGFSAGVCVESNDADLSAITSETPAPGTINYFMVGARSVCGRRFAPDTQGNTQTVQVCAP